jgi:hypothetical protein
VLTHDVSCVRCALSFVHSFIHSRTQDADALNNDLDAYFSSRAAKE